MDNTFVTRVKSDGTYDKTPPAPSTLLKRSNAIWLYILGFFTGIFVTLIVTILMGWIVDSGFPHSSWVNKAFYGYALGCSSIGEASTNA